MVDFVEPLREDAQGNDGGEELEEAGETQEPAVYGFCFEAVWNEAC